MPISANKFVAMKTIKNYRNNLNNSKVIHVEDSLSQLLKNVFGNEFEIMHQKIEEMHQVITEGYAPKNQCLTEYISEKDAKVEFNRKTTWFWNQRNSGRLKSKKLGGTVYYLKQDLLNLLSDK